MAVKALSDLPIRVPRDLPSRVVAWRMNIGSWQGNSKRLRDSTVFGVCLAESVQIEDVVHVVHEF